MWQTESPSSVQTYRKAVKTSNISGYSVRLNVIGPPGAGKTTLSKIVLKENYDSVESTNGIDIHRYKATLNQDGSIQKGQQIISEVPIQRLASVCDEVVIPNPVEDSNDGVYTENAKDPEELKYAYIFESVKNKRRRLTSEIPDCSDVQMEPYGHLMHIWDFGGHYMFHITHQLFHSKDAIYLLVVDVSESLEKVVKDEALPDKNQYVVPQSVKDQCLFWLQSIHSFVGDKEGNPVVILVGTHKDKVTGNETEKQKQCKRVFDDIRNSHLAYDKHIQKETFFLDNTSESQQEFNRLKAYIFKLAEENHNKKDNIPSSWIYLENHLKSERIRKYMKVDDLKAKMLDMSVENTEDIAAFLTYQHAHGSLIYFQDQALSEYVVLDPQWIVDGFRQIITSRQFFEEGDSELLEMREDLYKTGILKQRFIKKVWKETEDRKVWLMFLSYLGIISKVTHSHDQRKSNEQLDYIVPSLLGKKENTVVVSELCTIETGSIEFVFDDTVLAKTVYNHITSVLIHKWTPKEQKDGSPMLYLYLRVYQLRNRHIGVTRREDKRIIVHVGKELDIDKSTAQQTPLDSRVCDLFRREIEMAIKRTFDKFDVNCDDKYDVRIVEDLQQAKTVQHDEHRTSVSVKKFVKEWVADTMLTMTTERRLKPITGKELARIPNALGKNWELLCHSLGVDEQQVDRIKMAAPHAVATQMCRCLSAWKTNKGDEATWDVLIKEMAGNPSLSINWDAIKSIIDDRDLGYNIPF